LAGTYTEKPAKTYPDQGREAGEPAEENQSKGGSHKMERGPAPSTVAHAVAHRNPDAAAR